MGRTRGQRSRAGSELPVPLQPQGPDPGALPASQPEAGAKSCQGDHSVYGSSGSFKFCFQVCFFLFGFLFECLNYFSFGTV